MRKSVLYRPLILALLILHLVHAGCSVRVQDRVITRPEEAATLDGKSRFLKAHMLDGQVIVLADWQVNEADRIVVGTGTRYDANREAVQAGSEISIALDSVALFETNVSRSSPSVQIMTLVTVASIGFTIYCISNPKACFGSCPTFYADSPEGEILQAEGFSSSVLPSLEATDVDALYRAKAAGKRFTMRVSNEALETHMIRRADLLVVPRPEDGRVLYSTEQKFWSVSDMAAPTTVMAEAGEVTAAFADFDGVEYGSLTDSNDLAVKEVVTLTFAEARAGRLGLQIACRQSFLSTYLFYQALSFMGTQAGDVLAGVVRAGGNTQEMLGGPGRVLGGIEVLLPDATGNWRPVAEMHETGPLATDVHLVELPDSEISIQTVQLRMTRGHWRIDQVQLVALEKEVTPITVRPSRVLRDEEEIPEALARLLDTSAFLVTMPGDEYTLEYDLPITAEGCELFVESRGYYLEWMRDEWLKEEDPAMAFMMFTQPERALKQLAPGFKQVEPVIEDLFWGSRYAPHKN